MGWFKKLRKKLRLGNITGSTNAGDKLTKANTETQSAALTGPREQIKFAEEQAEIQRGDIKGFTQNMLDSQQDYGNAMRGDLQDFESRMMEESDVYQQLSLHLHLSGLH